MNLKVLVAEDEPDVLSLLASNLRNAGFEVFKAEDGAAALACCGIIGHLRLHRDSPPLGFWPR